MLVLCTMQWALEYLCSSSLTWTQHATYSLWDSPSSWGYRFLSTSMSFRCVLDTVPWIRIPHGYVPFPHNFFNSHSFSAYFLVRLALGWTTKFNPLPLIRFFFFCVICTSSTTSSVPSSPLQWSCASWWGPCWTPPSPVMYPSKAGECYWFASSGTTSTILATRNSTARRSSQVLPTLVSVFLLMEAETVLFNFNQSWNTHRSASPASQSMLD